MIAQCLQRIPLAMTCTTTSIRLLSMDTRCADSTPTSLESLMKKLMILAAIMLSACSTATSKQAASPAEAAPASQEQPSPSDDTPPVGGGLSDLDKMTFACSKAGLNAAAREAEKATTQGNYQFAYFRLVSDSHHSVYEVHFKSNNSGEPDLKYCVSVYCQQGWDPSTSKPPSVRLISDGSQPAGASAVGAVHSADCSDQQIRVKHRSKR